MTNTDRKKKNRNFKSVGVGRIRLVAIYINTTWRRFNSVRELWTFLRGAILLASNKIDLETNRIRYYSTLVRLFRRNIFDVGPRDALLSDAVARPRGRTLCPGSSPHPPWTVKKKVQLIFTFKNLTNQNFRVNFTAVVRTLSIESYTRLCFPWPCPFRGVGKPSLLENLKISLFVNFFFYKSFTMFQIYD